MIKKIMIGFGFVIVLVAALPMLITWNQYKTLIQSEFQKATGRELQIMGDVRMGILPSPYARVTDAVITNPSGAASKYFATVKSLDVGVALFPLLKKEIQVTHVAIAEPAITLETMANGQNNWQFITAKKDDTAATTADASDDEGSKISVDKLTIEKGFVRIVDIPGKSQQVIGPIEGDFNIADLKGPISGRGTVTLLEKLPVRYDVTVESIPTAPNGVIPFRASLALLGNAASVEFKGALQKGDTSVARIETAASIPHLDKILASMNKDNKAPSLPKFLQDKISVTGLLEVSGKKAHMDNLQFKSGGMEVSGALSVDTANGTDIAVDLGRITMPPEGAASSASATQTSSASLAKTLEDGFKTAAGLLDTALPTAPLGFVLTASQLPIPGQPTLRDVRIAATTGAKGVTLQTIEAKLPGNTVIAISGSLPARADGKIDTATFNAQITSQNMSAALGQTGDPMAVNVKTTARLTRQNLTLKPLDLLQNDQTISGQIVYDPSSTEVLQLAVKGAALNVDTLLGSGSKSGTAKSDDGKAQPKTDPLAKLQGLKAKIAIDLGRVTFQKKTADNVSVDALLGSDGLELRSAKIGDLGGMVVQATGKIAQFSPLKGVNINAAAQTTNLSTTLKALGNSEAKNLGASAFNASFDGGADKLNVDLNGTIDQGKISVKGVAGNINTAPSFNGKIDITHPETATIVRNFGGLKPVTNFGPFALKADVAYGTDTLKANDLLVQLGSAGTLKGHVNVIPENGNKKIDADLSADKLALAALMGDDTATSGTAAAQTTSAPTAWSRDPINLESLRGLNGKAKVSVGQLLYKEFVINNFQTVMNFANNTITLDTLKGGLFDAGTFNISGQLSPGKTGEAHRGNLNVAVDNTDAEKLFTALGSKVFASGTLDLSQKIAFSGASQYDLVRSLNGEGALKVTKGIVNGIDLDGLAAKMDRPNSLTDFAAIIDQARAGGQTPIGDLNAPINIRDGQLRLDNIAIKTQKTAMNLGGSANLPDKTVDMTGQISFVEQRNMPALTLYVRGPFSAPQKNFDTRAFTQFYASKATEKLQNKLEEKVQGKLNKLLGIPAPAPLPATPSTPAAPTSGISEPALSTEEAPASVNAPTAPTPPTAPSADSNTATPKPKKQNSEDALKQLGGQLLNNLLSGQQQQQ